MSFAEWSYAFNVPQILSIAFELAEYSLQHHLPNFAEVRCSHYDCEHLFMANCSVGGITYVI